MDRPKIGLALGSGGARGFAHLGVLKAFDDAEIPIDMIAGSSMGALVGCFYGVGHKMEDLYKLSTTFRRKYYLDFTVPKMGFISGKRIKEFIQLFTHNKNIEESKYPCQCCGNGYYEWRKGRFLPPVLSQERCVQVSLSRVFLFLKESMGDLLVDGGVD